LLIKPLQAFREAAKKRARGFLGKKNAPAFWHMRLFFKLLAEW
jgi:hypothetical protein